MFRKNCFRLALILTSGLGMAVSGCTSLLNVSKFRPALLDGHGTEQRVITLFTESLEEDNEAAFRRIVSTRFEKRALRSPEAYKDLEILNLPKSKLEVVESKELDGGGYETVAKSEKDGTKYQFLIIRDEEKRRWVVDDVMLRQQKKGTRAAKSSVEVMDLLLTTREFLSTWEAADKEGVLQSVSTDLREPLQSLPEPWLLAMMARVSGEYEEGMARRPQAQMNESDAVVKMPSKNGFLLLKAVRQDDRWLVSDIEVANRKADHHPGSILRQARAMNAVTSFLEAYGSDDQSQLRKFTEDKFYTNSLSVGDLSMIPLPPPTHAPEDYAIQSFAGQLTVIIPDDSSIVRLDLTTPEVANAKDQRVKLTTAAVETAFIIADVTVYDRQSEQHHNLKSAFTAPARAMLFLAALQARDLPNLKQYSARTLSEASWDNLDPVLFSCLPLTGVPSGEMTLQNSRVQGEVTELEFISSKGKICSVIMRDENGELKVVDVQYPDMSAMVASLRTQLMLTVPVIELAHAWESDSLESVRRISSMEFNRLVWSNLTAVPPQFSRLPDLLQQPVLRTQADDHRALVELANPGQPPVTVALLKENTAWVVDEISVPDSDGTRFELRKSLRQEIAQQFLVDPAGTIQQAHFEANSRRTGSILQAGGTAASERPRGNLSVQSYGTPATQNASVPQGIDMTPAPDEAMPAAKSQHDENGILRFGPAASAETRPSNGNPGAPSHIRPQVSAVAEEHDGVVYFKGTRQTPEADRLAEAPASGPSGGRIPITDPSSHPIEIPFE